MENIKRKNIRFVPDENTLIVLKTQNGVEVVGLACSESYSGCGGVFMASSELVEDIDIELQVGKLESQLATIKF
jgi:hypothetical protein